MKPQAKQLQTRVDSMLKILNKSVASAKVVKEIKTTKKKTTKVKHENSSSMDLGTANVNGNENEISSTKSKKKKKHDDESNKSKSNKKSATKEHKKKKKKRRDLSTPAMHYTASVEPQLVDGDLPPDIFAQCKEKMRPVKKSLKLLDNPNKGLSKEENDNEYKRSLLKIGEHIMNCLDEIHDLDMKKEWRNNLWTFVSKFTEFDPKKLYKLYKHTFKKYGKNQESSKTTSLSDKHYHSNNGESNNSNYHTNQYAHHINTSISNQQSKANYYQSNLNSSNFNKFSQQPQRHTGLNYQSKDYHHYNEKRCLSNNSPNKRQRTDVFQQNSILNSSTNKNLSSSNQVNRSSSHWHNNSSIRPNSFDKSNER